VERVWSGRLTIAVIDSSEPGVPGGRAYGVLWLQPQHALRRDAPDDDCDFRAH
jgi:hypothetical protein